MEIQEGQQLTQTPFRRYLKVNNTYHDVRDYFPCTTGECRRFGVWYGYEITEGVGYAVYRCAVHGLIRKPLV